MHEHDWRIAMVKNVFEPKYLGNATGPPIFEMVEYAYMLCKCGKVEKSKVTKQNT